jgi:aflatoxin B1 aldehyde reductase
LSLTDFHQVGDKSLDPTARYDTPNEVNAYLDAFYTRGGRQLDTARLYSPHAPGSSEPRLGLVDAGNKFIIDTKVFSREPGSHAKGKVEENINTSLKELKIPQINVEYLHAPDRATPFEVPLQALNEAYKEGKFKQFGLSNYTAEEVEKIVQICEERGYVKPTVYQGQYNPIVRSGEKELFPVLRKHGIAFYAWRSVCLPIATTDLFSIADQAINSPAAGGFFARNHKSVQGGSRYDSSVSI